MRNRHSSWYDQHTSLIQGLGSTDEVVIVPGDNPTESKGWTPDGSGGWIDADGNPVDLDEDEGGGAGGTTPGATGVRPSNWDLSTSPATYVVGSGDTFVGLTKAYLDPSGVRWRELWKFNPQVQNPNVLGVGTVLNMPKEAADNFRAMMKKENITPKGAAPADEKKGVSPVAMAIVAAALITGGIALATR